MKPSLYSKIRPAGEIKRVDTEFKVANDAIALRATKSEMQANTGENKWLVSRYDMNLGGESCTYICAYPRKECDREGRDG